MTPKHTQGIVLTRTNFSESDRIVTLLTNKFGKIKVIAKGVRKERSRLAGGIELFSISEIGFIQGRGELDTLVSARLIKHYDQFLGDLEKVNFAYECLKNINRITADAADEQYFILLETLFDALNDRSLDLVVINIWWVLRFLNLTGHTINLQSIVGGESFTDNQKYIFDSEHGGFVINKNGTIKADHIKYLRLAMSSDSHTLYRVKNGQKLATDLLPYLRGFIELVH